MSSPEESEEIYAYLVVGGRISPDRIQALQAMVSEYLGSTVTKLVSSPQPLELFRFEGDEVVVQPEPWVTAAEVHNIYFFDYLPEHPTQKPGNWPTMLYHELATMLSDDKVLKNKQGEIEGLDREALRELIDLEQQPGNSGITGEKRRTLLRHIRRRLEPVKPTEQ